MCALGKTYSLLCVCVCGGVVLFAVVLYPVSLIFCAFCLIFLRPLLFWVPSIAVPHKDGHREESHHLHVLCLFPPTSPNSPLNVPLCRNPNPHLSRLLPLSLSARHPDLLPGLANQACLLTNLAKEYLSAGNPNLAGGNS